MRPGRARLSRGASAEALAWQGRQPHLWWPDRQEARMKNPFMSMWLSHANRALGVGRGMVTAEMRRQQSAAAKQALRASGLGGTAKPKKKRPTKKKGS
jgi:hypothetical protein